MEATCVTRDLCMIIKNLVEVGHLTRPLNSLWNVAFNKQKRIQRVTLVYTPFHFIPLQGSSIPKQPTVSVDLEFLIYR